MTNKRKPFIVLITGASGSGKTTTLKAREETLPRDFASINYFDDIGIPSPQEMIEKYGSGHKWQEATTRSWIDKLSKIDNKRIVVLEGSFYPEFALARLQELDRTSYMLICIHADRKTREERLALYRKQPELISQDMENYAQVLKQKVVDLGFPDIDTSNKSIAEVVEEIKGLIFNHIE